MNKERKSFKSKIDAARQTRSDKANKAAGKPAASRIQNFSEKLFLLGERSPNYVLGYN